MARIKIKCPSTGKPVDTGMSMDKSTFNTASISGNSFRCPECEKTHTWNKSEAFLEEEQA